MEEQTKPKPAAAAKPKAAAKRRRAAAAQSKRKPAAKAKSSRARAAARTGASKRATTPASTPAGTTSQPEERGERTPDRARQWATQVLGAQDEVAQALAQYHRRVAASPGMPPLLSTLSKSQAELVHSASDVYVSTARRYLDGTARAGQRRR